MTLWLLPLLLIVGTTSGQNVITTQDIVNFRTLVSVQTDLKSNPAVDFGDPFTMSATVNIGAPDTAYIIYSNYVTQTSPCLQWSLTPTTSGFDMTIQDSGGTASASIGQLSSASHNLVVSVQLGAVTFTVDGTSYNATTTLPVPANAYQSIPANISTISSAVNYTCSVTGQNFPPSASVTSLTLTAVTAPLTRQYTGNPILLTQQGIAVGLVIGFTTLSLVFLGFMQYWLDQRAKTKVSSKWLQDHLTVLSAFGLAKCNVILRGRAAAIALGVYSLQDDSDAPLEAWITYRDCESGMTPVRPEMRPIIEGQEKEALRATRRRSFMGMYPLNVRKGKSTVQSDQTVGAVPEKITMLMLDGTLAMETRAVPSKETGAAGEEFQTNMYDLTTAGTRQLLQFDLTNKDPVLAEDWTLSMAFELEPNIEPFVKDVEKTKGFKISRCEILVDDLMFEASQSLSASFQQRVLEAENRVRKLCGMGQRTRVKKAVAAVKKEVTAVKKEVTAVKKEKDGRSHIYMFPDGEHEHVMAQSTFA